ncbi:MAG: FAD-binding oxidoreductase, partial [Flavobacteriales bacterium]
MPTFHDIQVQSVHRETAESVVVALDIPDALRADFQFAAGQYLTLRTTIDGEDIRRSYSLCSSPGDGAWHVGIKKVPGGKFSTYANDVLKAGDTLQVMDPQGRFVLAEGAGKHHVGFAAGS